MSAIKDIVDLVTQLRNSVQDRKFAAEITQIQSLISAVQLENSSIVSESLDLKTENFELKKENSVLRQQVSELEKQQSELTATHRIEIAKITDKSHNSAPVKKWPTCPKCLEPAYQFTGEYAKPANDFFASVIRIPIHKCASCGYTDTGK